METDKAKKLIPILKEELDFWGYELVGSNFPSLRYQNHFVYIPAHNRLTSFRIGNKPEFKLELPYPHMLLEIGMPEYHDGTYPRVEVINTYYSPYTSKKVNLKEFDTQLNLGWFLSNTTFDVRSSSARSCSTRSARRCGWTKAFHVCYSVYHCIKEDASSEQAASSIIEVINDTLASTYNTDYLDHSQLSGLFQALHEACGISFNYNDSWEEDGEYYCDECDEYHDSENTEYNYEDCVERYTRYVHYLADHPEIMDQVLQQFAANDASSKKKKVSNKK